MQPVNTSPTGDHALTESSLINVPSWPKDYLEAFNREDYDWSDSLKESVIRAILFAVRHAEVEDAERAGEGRKEVTSTQRETYLQASDVLGQARRASPLWRRVHQLSDKWATFKRDSVEYAAMTLLYEQAAAAATQDPNYAKAESAFKAAEAAYDQAKQVRWREYNALVGSAPGLCSEIKEGQRYRCNPCCRPRVSLRSRFISGFPPGRTSSNAVRLWMR